MEITSLDLLKVSWVELKIYLDRVYYFILCGITHGH